MFWKDIFEEGVAEPKQISEVTETTLTKLPENCKRIYTTETSEIYACEKS